MKSIIHSTENNNFYLYDTQRILSMLIHPELKKIHEKSTYKYRCLLFEKVIIYQFTPPYQ